MSARKQFPPHLMAHYLEPHRVYHTLDHIKFIDELIRHSKNLFDDLKVVRVANWFHDIVYDPKRSDNEERSALMMRRANAYFQLTPAQVERIDWFIMCTKKHEATDDNDLGMFLDFDLAVLAEAEDAYMDYAAAVRAEYIHVPELEYTRGRAQFLRSMLDRPAIYNRFIALEGRARRNLQAELATLEVEYD